MLCSIEAGVRLPLFKQALASGQTLTVASQVFNSQDEIILKLNVN